MLIYPNEQWHWLFDADKKVMTLELGEELLFVSALSNERCVPYAKDDIPFNTEHGELYYQFLDGLDSYAWPAPVKVQIVLNAVTMVLYHKPLLPQSWFFQPLAHSSFARQSLGDIVVSQTTHGMGRFMIIEASESSYTLLFIDNHLQLDDFKQLQQFDVIKVMHDRVLPLQVMTRRMEYANVG